MRHAVRRLGRTPGFTILCVLTVALAVGVNTAVFSLVDALLLRPLPYADSHRLVNLWESIRQSGRGGVAFPNFADLEKQAQSFSDLAAWSSIEADVTDSGHADRLLGENVSPSYFRVLGATPALGREFTAQDDLEHPAVILSHGFWQTRFGSDPNVLGRTVNLSGSEFTVVGVMPSGFHGYSGTAQLWVPIATHDLIYPQVARFDFVHSRDIHWVRVIGKLRDGVSPAMAAAEVKAIGDRLSQAYPHENRERSFSLAPAQQDLARNYQPALIALLAAVGLVLLIAAANLSNLFLIRLSRRERELAVRLALGAKRTNLFSLVLSETAMVVSAGAIAGVALFFFSRELLVSILPLNFPSFASPQLDLRLVVYTMAAVLFTVLAMTVLPVWQLSRRDPQSALATGGRSEVAGQHRSRALLAVVEVALSVTLTIGAGLVLKSLWQLQKVDPGFRPDHLVTLRFDVPNGKYEGNARLALGDAVTERIRRVPGVESAAVTSVDPFVWPGLNRGFTPEGQQEVTSPQNFYNDEITPGYFRTSGIPQITGRDFTAHDDTNSPAVAIVSGSFARRIWPGLDAIGKRVKFGGPKTKWMTVVGVVGDAQVEDLHQAKSDLAILYTPLRRSDAIISLSVLARTQGDPDLLLPSLREALQQFDPDMPVYSTATLEQRLAGERVAERSYAILMAVFGTIAVALALIGVYGVFAFNVAQRVREIGIRMALGAQRGQIAELITRQAAVVASVGVFAGLAAAFVLTRFMASVLFQVNTHDAVIFGGVSVLLAVAAVTAGYLPARRAASIDPLEALRQE
jgi:putative ABC transport system permease protein